MSSRHYDFAGHAHELTFSTYRRHAFLKSERVCEWLAEAIHDSRRHLEFALWAYVFMPDHVHLLIYPHRADYEMSVILKSIKQPVARVALKSLRDNASDWIPKLTVRRGARTEARFWQSGGGYDRNVTEGTTLRAMIDYLHLNPVRRNLVDSAAEWQWSSAAWFFGGQPNSLKPDPIPAEWLD